MTEQSHSRLSEVLQKVTELAQKAVGGDYLYRGEPELYPKVSSSLYREYSDIESEYFDVKVVQEEMLREAKRFIGETDDAILEQLQHFGYPTNQIDFTADYNIALFFACYSELEKDGRVILLDKGRDDLKQPKAPENRVIAQRSVFVRPPQGFVEPSHIVVIPQGLKRPILDYLEKNHGINAAALFNDIHGFIRYHSVHESAYAEFYAGVTNFNKREYDKAIERYSKSIDLNPQLYVAYTHRSVAYWHLGNYNRTIQDSTRAIELEPSFARAYQSRGAAYWHQGNYNRATQDFNKAVELDPSNSISYFNRGLSKISTEEWGNAAADLSQAQSLGLDIISTFRDEFGSVGDFEQNYSVQLPEDIKAVLTPQQ